MQLVNHAIGSRLPKNCILFKNVNERKISSKDSLVNYKGRKVSGRVLDFAYICNLKAQGMQAGLFDYTFMYEVEHAGKRFCSVAMIELKRDAREKLLPTQITFKQKLDELGVPNLTTHDPEVGLAFLISLCKCELSKVHLQETFLQMAKDHLF